MKLPPSETQQVTSGRAAHSQGHQAGMGEGIRTHTENDWGGKLSGWANMLAMPSTQEAEARGLPQVQDQPGLPSEIQASLDSRVRSCIRNKNKQKSKNNSMPHNGSSRSPLAVQLVPKTSLCCISGCLSNNIQTQGRGRKRREERKLNHKPSC